MTIRSDMRIDGTRKMGTGLRRLARDSDRTIGLPCTEAAAKHGATVVRRTRRFRNRSGALRRSIGAERARDGSGSGWNIVAGSGSVSYAIYVERLTRFFSSSIRRFRSQALPTMARTARRQLPRAARRAGLG